MEPLKPLKKRIHTGQVVLVIMDGMGLSPNTVGNAFLQARTPTLDLLMKTCPYTRLRAHGTAVGLPSDDDMGNSEVGHNALGAGRIFDQGAKLVNRALESGGIFDTPVWKKLVEKPRDGAALHLIGLLSDGNVHSHIDQLFLLLEKAAEEKVKKARVHILLDGRDVPETSALIYVDRLEERLARLNGGGLDYRIASGGGRMVVTMDRYEADWEVVRAGWRAHVLGKARHFSTAREAIESFREEDHDITDQYLPAFTVADGQGPVGPILDGDSIIFFNFRGDRAIEISRAFAERDFNKFDRERFPDVYYAGMMEYDGDLKIPANYLVQPPEIDRTISEYLVHSGCRQYAVSETQKFGHVTYFWNGNRSGMFDHTLEVYEEIPSDRVQFDERPWMKAAEITDSVVEALRSGKFDFLRLNYPNGDMVGHTGNFEAAVIAAETVDLCLKRLLAAVEGNGGCALITADHGNLDEMYQLDKKGNPQMDKVSGEPLRKTSHTLNPVPFIIYHPSSEGGYALREFDTAPGLGNVASTILNLLGYEAPGEYLPPLIKIS